VNLFIAVTDWDWFSSLRDRPDLTEVNFWQPGGKTEFRALQPGELFLFKLHSPRNYIAGCGIYAEQSIIPISVAWEAFGIANGASSLEEMRQRVSRYRRSQPLSQREDYKIGCRILTQPSFWPEELWIPVPDSWSANIVAGKRYSADEIEGARLWQAAFERLGTPTAPGLAESPARFGGPVLITPRLGQGAFRVAVIDAYSRRCAVTCERTLPALDAAHIRPYALGGKHDVNNGILFRRDLHPLFDLGYVTITEDYRFEVSKRIRQEFENGRDYYALNGRPVRFPEKVKDRPDPAALRWHNKEVFLG